MKGGVNMFKMSYLMQLTKAISDNLRILHRNIIGDNWLPAHERLADWYEYIDNLQDDVTEVGIMLGYEENSVQELNIEYPKTNNTILATVHIPSITISGIL